MPGLEDLDEVTVVSAGLAGGGLGLLILFVLYKKVMREPTGGGKMEEIAVAIQEGAAAFLRKEYTFLALFVVVMAVVVGIATESWDKSFPSFIIGAILSGACGWLGMWIAVRANVRTCNASQRGLNEGLIVAFASGGVMGLSCTSVGLLGLAILYLGYGDGDDGEDTAYLAGFGFGASSIALFARVGGGIYTKAADVGADLVGKVEAGIPEDDPRNPATIADNVGDNVGDVAGMGADLFESFVGSIIGAIQLAPFANGVDSDDDDERLNQIRQRIALPFWIAGFGIACSVIGIFAVRTKNNVPKEKLQDALLHSIRNGIVLASLLAAGASLVAAGVLIGWEEDAYSLFGCVAIGLAAGVLIGEITEYFTSFAYSPTQNISKSSITGPATVIIQGLGVGLISTLPPVIVIVAAIIACEALQGVYGIAIAAVGMLSTLGVTLATDAFGPVADNAGGIAEMAGLPEEVRERTDGLDALGNTTAATGKGFAIGSAGLTALALLNAFVGDSDIPDDEVVDVLDSYVLASAIIGAMLPFLFGALTMLAVGRSAGSIIFEVRRQFREISGLMDGTTKPEYAKCVEISTQAAIIEMVVPSMIAIFAPLIVGFMFGSKALAGMLVGALTSGIMLALTMANAGGAWDNAKKWVEAEGLGRKEDGMAKGSEYHAATVIGDTVGDPFKDTSGPALNILIKLMTMLSLVFASTFGVEAWDVDNYWYIGIVLIVVLVAFVAFWTIKFGNYNQVNFDSIHRAQPTDGVFLEDPSAGVVQDVSS